ncbi:uncharacterized protein FIBRA_02401 [Fibroporia radiculosa]|uniref:Uncharacterized protein n=1 Tax=Fibroporia radiculosa TaxID=599839 RepID=J4I915_9APHY|nr:uncharacterized protein FIBRA_02401 [Fibroporia radiculosa]CCM00371.1 predicted protein [Fibroporia radiculosa]
MTSSNTWSSAICLDSIYHVQHKAFARQTQLVEHFNSAHTDLLGEGWPPPLGKLKLVRTPCIRTAYTNDLPAIPSSSTPSYDMVAPHITRALKRPLELSQLQLSSSQRTRKWAKMAVQEPVEEEEDDDMEVLEDLPSELALPSGREFFSDFIFRRKPPEPAAQLARPQYIVFLPIREEPPVSMGYGAFKARFAELERAGLIDGTGEWPDESSRSEPPEGFKRPFEKS